MSLTVEALAQEINRVDGGQCLDGPDLAKLLLPFIERHIAAGQQGAGHVNALIKELADSAQTLGHWETLRSTDQATIDYWTDRVADLSRQLTTPQPPNPAGAVPLPDRDAGGRIVRDAWVRWALTQPNPKPSWLVPYHELSEPDKEADRQIFEACAREAAGRAVAVPDGLAVAIFNAVQEYENPRISFVTNKDKATHRQQVAMLRNFAGSLIEDAAAPIPQQPAAEGAAVNQSLTTPAHAKLGVIIATLESWLMFNAEGWKREGVENPPDDASVVANEWPTRSVLKNWIAVLQETALYTHPTPAADAGGVIAPQALINELCNMQERWLARVAGEPGSRRIKTVDDSASSTPRRGEDDYDNHAYGVRRCASDLDLVICKLQSALTPEVRHGE